MEGLVQQQLHSVKDEIVRPAQHAFYFSRLSWIRDFLVSGDHDLMINIGNEFKVFGESIKLYDQIRLLNHEGKEGVRVNFLDGGAELVPMEKLQDKGDRPYFIQGLALPFGEVYISPMDLNVERGEIELPYKPVLRYVVPVTDSQGSHHGVVVLNYLGEKLIQRYLNVSIHRSVESFLFAGNSYSVYLKGGYVAKGPMSETKLKQNIAERFPAEWNEIVGFNNIVSGPEMSDPADRVRYSPSFEKFSHDISGESHVHRTRQILSENGLFTFIKVSPRQLLGSSVSLNEDDDWVFVTFLSTDDLEGDAIAHFNLNHYHYIIIALLVIWLIIAWLWAKSEAHSHRITLNLQEATFQKNLLLKKQLSVQEEERSLIARELHDELGQLLLSINSYASVIANSSTNEGAESTFKNALRIIELSKGLQQIIRNRLKMLRPTSFGHLNFSESLIDMLEEFEFREKIKCSINCPDKFPELSDFQQVHLFRMVQEALTNIGKHSNASKVDCSMECSSGVVKFSIKDNGDGVNELGEMGFGLTGIRERSELLGGHCEILSKAGEGVQVIITFPLKG